jgi:hypothetical protein
MPKQAVLPVVHPMTLVREVQETRCHAETLENVESLKALCLHNAIIEVVVDNELRCASIGEMRKRVPELVILALIPHSAVVVMLDEPDFISCVGTYLVHFSVVTHERFKFATKVVALNPA